MPAVLALPSAASLVSTPPSGLVKGRGTLTLTVAPAATAWSAIGVLSTSGSLGLVMLRVKAPVVALRPPEVAVTLTLTSVVPLGGLPVNTPVPASKCSQAGSGSPLASVAL